MSLNSRCLLLPEASTTCAALWALARVTSALVPVAITVSASTVTQFVTQDGETNTRVCQIEAARLSIRGPYGAYASLLSVLATERSTFRTLLRELHCDVTKSVSHVERRRRDFALHYEFGTQRPGPPSPSRGPGASSSSLCRASDAPPRAPLNSVL